MSRPVTTIVWAMYGQSFGTNLRDIRMQRELSQTALAEISGVSRNQISNLERNENGPHHMGDPQLSTVYRLALALEVPPSALLPGSIGPVEPGCEGPCCADRQGEGGIGREKQHYEEPTPVHFLRPFPRSYVEHKRFSARPWA